MFGCIIFDKNIIIYMELNKVSLRIIITSASAKNEAQADMEYFASA